MIGMIVGKILQWLYPGYGHCQKCKYPWKIVMGHDVKIIDGNSFFALCNRCWNKVSVNEAISYYKKDFFRPSRYAGCSTLEQIKNLWPKLKKNIIKDKSLGAGH